jgi:hypothetical protein
MAPITIGDYTVELAVYPLREYSAVDSEEKYDHIYLQDGEYSFATMVAIKASLPDEPLKAPLLEPMVAGQVSLKTASLLNLTKLLSAVLIVYFVCRYLIYRLFGKPKLIGRLVLRSLNIDRIILCMVS